MKISEIKFYKKKNFNAYYLFKINNFHCRFTMNLITNEINNISSFDAYLISNEEETKKIKDYIKIMNKEIQSRINRELKRKIAK